MAGSKKIKIPVLDGGRGWLAVLAGAIANFISMGLYRSGGIIYMASATTFSVSRTVAAWIPMVTLMVVFLTAPITTYLATRFTFHRVVLCGGILAFIGMLISFGATKFETVFCGWSLIFGLGSSAAFFPSLAIVGQCFKKKRPLANGLVLAGGAVGCTCLPPLFEYLIESYRLSGTCLILAGVVMNYFVCASLLYSVFNVPTVKKSTLLQEVPVLENINDKIEEPGSEHNLEPEIKSSPCKLDLSVVKNFTFLTNCFSNGIQVALFLGMVTILPDFGQDEIGTSSIEGAYFVSATAIADLSTRLLCGICLTNLKLRKDILYLIILLVNAADFVILAFVPIYSVVIAASVLGGACFACGMILYFEILATCQSSDKYPLAFGLSEMMKAPFLLATASSVGSLKDATGSYKITFLIFSTTQTIAALVWIIEILRKKTHNSKNKSEDTENKI